MADHLLYDPITGHLAHKTNGHLLYGCTGGGGGDCPCCSTYTITFDEDPDPIVVVLTTTDCINWSGYVLPEETSGPVILTKGETDAVIVYSYAPNPTSFTGTLDEDGCPSDNVGDWTSAGSEGYPTSITSIIKSDCP